MKIRGKIIKGAGRGKELGFPTANVEAAAYMEEGIYLGYADGRPALIFIGAAETFGESKKKIEVYVLDFDGDLYGQEIEVELLKKTRDNQKFASKDDLVAQMRRDEEVARKHFNL